MTQIRTRQLRRVQSTRLGEMLIEHVYVDEMATLETWIDHCAVLGIEFGLAPVEVHKILFHQFPEIFGR